MVEQDNDQAHSAIQMSGSISFVDIDRMSKKHFPLCMQEVLEFFFGSTL